MRKLLGLVLTATLWVGACSRRGAEDPPQVGNVEPGLAQAIGRAVRPCIRAHQTVDATVYTAELRLERGELTGTAIASFSGVSGRPRGHEDFETCVLQAIRQAGIPLARATTLPVAFDLGAKP